MNARAGNPDSLAVIAPLGIDAAQIDRIVRVSITLDDLSVLSSSEEELRDVGWIPEGHSLAPSLHIADLICITDILDSEVLTLHYFAERFHFQKQFDLLGDELDFLSLYLSTGFNLGPSREDFKRLVISGLSGPIDRYYDARDAGITVRKPKANLHKTFREIIDRLAVRKPPGWTTIGVHLLNSASPDEQKQVERGLASLRKSVTSKAYKHGDHCYMQIMPALDRKAIVGFYAYTEKHKADRKERMEGFLSQALAEDETTACVIFGRNTDRWGEPYEVVLLGQKEGTLR
ncbi:MAG: hypothetical protein EOP20_05880 [Hyphomicrobiales bacterium]|nr:MAG: hypothetical protein EOP20_05880 [Hyphomicrobiales bacterium]